ncbi:MAG: NfeD family protein [bacterium]
MDYTTLLITLLLAGALLIGAEIFVPGAVAGSIGGFALLGAVIVAFNISVKCGFYILFGVFILVALTIVSWILWFPKSGMGKKMTLSEDGKGFKASDSRQGLLGKTGMTQSELRPAGYALIDGKRIDVVSEGGIIDKDLPVIVLKVEGSRVVVRKVDA